MGARMIMLALIASACGVAGCGGGNGEMVESSDIEARLEATAEDQAGDDYEYDVRCHEEIEAGTDFECIGYPIGLDGAGLSMTAHLDDDGETVSEGAMEPVRVDAPTDPPPGG